MCPGQEKVYGEKELRGISSQNSIVSGKDKSVMAEAGIVREGDTGGRNFDISGYMNTVQPHFNNFSGCMYDAFPSFWYLDSVHLEKGSADDCIQTFQVFISLNFVHIEIVSMYTILVIVK